MNERIHDLAMLARKHFPKTETSGEFWVLDEEKFAELIVRECAAVLDKRIAPPNHPMNSLGYKLKKHFGAEE